ncbi:MAG: ribbon-helix-helix protein, CopG family [Bacteroidetes bacterium]|nr:ribbon-helix-helix protein, CopG family [Bacteroidota bacterium]
MRKTVSISLPNALKGQLDEAAQEEGLSRSDVVRQALSDYLFIRRFRRLRARMMSRAQAQGIFTDEDVFEQVS